MEKPILSKETYYFEQQGKLNMENTIMAVKKRAVEEGLKKVLMFTSEGEGPMLALKIFSETEIELIAVTFPYRQVAHEKTKDGEKRSIILGISDDEKREVLKNRDIKIIQGVMPFQDIIIPGAKDIKLETIKNTLSLFGTGLQLCIEAIIMACEYGAVEQGEEVISMAADTAIIATGSLKSLLFSPIDGMEIREIICKPRYLNINRKRELLDVD